MLLQLEQVKHRPECVDDFIVHNNFILDFVFVLFDLKSNIVLFVVAEDLEVEVHVFENTVQQEKKSDYQPDSNEPQRVQ